MNRLAKLLLLCVIAGNLQAAVPPANHWALLIGVSEYPSLSAERQLRGPRNDVVSMRETLLATHADWRRITVLADGVPKADGLPTRALIASNLERLAREAQPGDFVVVYFSGHGSQQPAAANDRDEADGLDEIFLPRDIGRWDGKAGSVRNALTDNEINRLIAPLLAAGAQVWAVFDTCHSGTMTRGVTGSILADTEVQRSVRPAELGVPLFSTRTTQAISRATQGQSTWSQNLVVFSAAQSGESTPELRLPAGDPARVEHGLFTYTLARALRANGAGSYAALAQTIATRYAILQRSAPTPLFEGSLLSVVPLAAPSPPLDLRVSPVRVSEPALCSRKDKRPPCDTAQAEGDAALQIQATKWLSDAATPGSNIQRVTNAVDADIALIVRGARVWMVATADDYRVGDRRPPAVASPAAFAVSLRAIANVQRLTALAERPSASLDLAVTMYRVAPGSGNACKTQPSSQLDLSGPPPSLRAGESLCMVLSNKGMVPIDVTILHVGADYSVQPLFPLRSETNRIAPRTERRVALEIVAEETPTLDRVIALAMDAQGEDIVDFSWVSQPGIDRSARGTEARSRALWMQTLRWIAMPAHGPS